MKWRPICLKGVETAKSSAKRHAQQWTDPPDRAAPADPRKVGVSKGERSSLSRAVTHSVPTPNTETGVHWRFQVCSEGGVSTVLELKVQQAKGWMLKQEGKQTKLSSALYQKPHLDHSLISTVKPTSLICQLPLPVGAGASSYTQQPLNLRLNLFNLLC